MFIHHCRPSEVALHGAMLHCRVSLLPMLYHQLRRPGSDMGYTSPIPKAQRCHPSANQVTQVTMSDICVSLASGYDLYIAMVCWWPIEIDGLPNLKMVIFHGYVK